MENCLIVKYKSEVSNPNLPTFDTLVLKTTAVSNPAYYANDNGTNTLLFKATKDVTVKTTSNFINPADGSALQDSETTITAGTIGIVGIKNQTGDTITVSNASSIEYIYFAPVFDENLLDTTRVGFRALVNLKGVSIYKKTHNNEYYLSQFANMYENLGFFTLRAMIGDPDNIAEIFKANHNLNIAFIAGNARDGVEDYRLTAYFDSAIPCPNLQKFYAFSVNNVEYLPTSITRIFLNSSSTGSLDTLIARKRAEGETSGVIMYDLYNGSSGSVTINGTGKLEDTGNTGYIVYDASSVSVTTTRPSGFNSQMTLINYLQNLS